MLHTVLTSGNGTSLINNADVAVNFYFPFVSYSLAHITIPQNKGKTEIKQNKKLTATLICRQSDFHTK